MVHYPLFRPADQEVFVSFDEKHDPTGTMSHPPIDAEDFARQPHASVYVCEDARCQHDAAEHIHRQTGNAGTYRPFPARKG